MSYFLDDNHAPITLRVIVDHIQRFYFSFADHDLSAFVEFGIGVLLLVLGMTGIKFTLLKWYEFMSGFLTGLVASVKGLIFAIENQVETPFKNYLRYTWQSLGIAFNLVAILVTTGIAMLPLWLCGALCWYSGKYFWSFIK